jgi:hypothetical protein
MDAFATMTAIYRTLRAFGQMHFGKNWTEQRSCLKWSTFTIGSEHVGVVRHVQEKTGKKEMQKYVQRLIRIPSLKTFFYPVAFAACAIMALSSGCASGGFKLTRQYATWVNSQQVVLRVILYILTGVVFVVTMLIDLVVFNTMDFWDGRVSAGTYSFEKDGKIFQAKHEFLIDPASNLKLKRSTIRVMDSHHSLLQEVVLNETVKGEIEMSVDGKLRARVHGLSELPMATLFNQNGKAIGEHVLLLNTDFSRISYVSSISSVLTTSARPPLRM